MKIIIRHYGAFRKLGGSTALDMPAPATVGAIKTALAATLGAQNALLVGDSVIAGDTDILPDEFVIDEHCTLSILPPVCGG